MILVYFLVEEANLATVRWIISLRQKGQEGGGGEAFEELGSGLL